MPSVIKLSKTDLIDFARILILANTPLSLFKGMVRCPGMDKLRAYPATELIAYYDRLTARARRSEFTAALAYALLCAVVLHARETRDIQIDPSRLQWGAQIWEFMTQSTIITNYIDIKPTIRQPQISAQNLPSANTRLFGPDNQQLFRVGRQ